MPGPAQTAPGVPRRHLSRASVTVGISPATVSLLPGATQQFTVSVTGTASTAVTWSVQEAGGGTVTSTGLYTAPGTAGTYHVVATSVADPARSASAAVTVSPQPYPVGLSDASLVVGGVTRAYRVHVPATLPSPPTALVLVLHGGGGEGLDVANTGAHPLSVFRTVADREGFVVVYPGGLPARDGKPGWDDCRGDNLMASGADDLGFLDALIARVRGEYGLPVSRVFMTGGSNGAQMTLAYAVTRSANVAAVAPGSGNLPLTPKPGACSAAPSRPVPILMTHGTADTMMPYDGGCVANIGGACNRGRVIGAEATRDHWLAVNGLTGVTPAQTVVDLDTTDGGPANRFVYAGIAPVEWWRLDGAGHTAASRTVPVSPNPLTGIQNRDVEFAEVAWAFFEARLPMSTPPTRAVAKTERGQR
ncbi:MAG: hypothetical protein AB2L07_10435 [Thermoanaerobaculaceae bacterium]